MTIEYKQPTKEEFSNIMGSFWFMLRECENQAENNNDVVLKRTVEQLYLQWNDMQVGKAPIAPRWKEQS
jgi:hypothetical protein